MPTESSTAGLQFFDTNLNTHLRADLRPLEAAERADDLQYGIFRFRDSTMLVPDASRPGLDKPAYALVNQIYPLLEEGQVSLMQTGCLWTGRKNTGWADELRLSWELEAWITHAGDDPEFYEAFWKLFGAEGGQGQRLGMCSFSHPEARLLFYHPEAAPHVFPPDSCGITVRSNGAAFELPLTMSYDHPEENFNLRGQCRAPDLYWIDFREFAGPPAAENPDATCPVEPFGGAQTQITHKVRSFSGLSQGDRAGVCAIRESFVPDHDASLRLDWNSDTGPVNAEGEWLRPNVMVVSDQRTVARRMARPDPLQQTSALRAWSTPVERRHGDSGPARWGENFTPHVRVDSATVLSRAASGGDERVVTAGGLRNNILKIKVPKPGGLVATFQCVGFDDPKTAGHELLFRLTDCTGSDGAIPPLTPTYAVANLTATVAIEQPITWEVEVACGVEPDACRPAPQRDYFLRFQLKVVQPGAALRVSALANFGRIQENEPSGQQIVLLDNPGGEPMRVDTVSLVGPHAGDFSFFVKGAPTSLPLPVDFDLKDGAATLTLGADAGDLLRLVDDGSAVTVSIGDSERGPLDEESLTVYGERVRLRGAIVLRDDAAATFDPGSGLTRPLAVAAWTELAPPFVVAAGDAVEIVVTALPRGRGQRSATLRVNAVQQSNPAVTARISSQLRVEGIQGPILAAAPDLLVFTAPRLERMIIYFNAGPLDLNVRSATVGGPHRARFALSFVRPPAAVSVLRPGEFQDVRISYAPECDGTYGNPDHQAQLIIASDGGDAVVRLVGDSYGFCEVP